MIACNSLILLFLFIVIGEILTILEAYKPIRPYKYYHPRSSHRPRWHPGPRTPKWRSPRKRPPPRHYPRYRPKYHRYPPRYENGIDYASEDQPYTIEIELPRRYGASGKYNKHIHGKRGYNKGEVYDEPEYEDYNIEDEYSDGRDRVIRTGEKKVRIKVIKGAKPKLNIKISRIDDLKENETKSGPIFQPQISTDLEEPETQLFGEWVPPSPKPSYPVHLRGA